MNNNTRHTSHTATSVGLKSCLVCHNTIPHNQPKCDICHTPAPRRIPNSLSKTTALLITASILFIPANILPVMTTSSIIETQDSTILSGILHLWESEAYSIAIIVLIASFITPLFKMLSIGYLCYTCYKRSPKHKKFRTKLYHINEIIGRWSMIDVFVIAVLGALVQIGALASIEPRIGILAFAAVVFLSIFSLHYFDPRLIWDTETDPFSPNNDTLS